MFPLSAITDQLPTFFGAPGTGLLAYLDPGTGSMLLQLSIAALLSGAFFLKSFYLGLREMAGRLFRRGAAPAVGLRDH